MKLTLILLSLLLTGALATAQKKLPQERALAVARIVGADAQQLKATPIPTDVDLQQPVAVTDEQYGGMVLPQKGLKTDTLRTAGDKAVAIGQLWLRKLTVMRNGEAVANDKLRLVTVNANGTEETAAQCTLAVRKVSEGKLELVVLGAKADPVATAPLQDIDTGAATPLDLDGERDGDNGKLTVKILGKYQAVIPVTEQSY